MKFNAIAATAAFCLMSSNLMAHEFKAGDLTVDHPMAFETAPMAMTGGGFMSITNTGDELDRLIAVRADFPKVEIHQTVEKDGVAQMLPVEAIKIAPGQTVTLQPGGFHVMFMGLDGRQLAEGEEVPATLVFEKAGDLAVVFKVEKRPEGMTMKHGDHNAAPSN